MPTQIKKNMLAIAFQLCCISIFCQVQVNFTSWFTDETMRVDLNHFGISTEEHFSFASIRKEGIWAGSRNNLFDTLNLGDYFIVINDIKTNRQLFSSGFSSEFEGNENWNVFSDCVRFPFPRKPVQISIGKRNKNNIGFHEIWNDVIDPSSSNINCFPVTTNTSSKIIFESGDPSIKVDIVILGDGYNDSEKEAFFHDAERASDFLFSVSPYKESKSFFNVRSVFAASEQSGITSPLDKIWKNTAFGSSYNNDNIERRIGLNNNSRVHDVAATVPYDFIIILTNSKRYGGEGIYHTYSTVAINSAWAKYLVVHEFEHNFATMQLGYFTTLKQQCMKDRYLENDYAEIWFEDGIVHIVYKSGCILTINNIKPIVQ